MEQIVAIERQGTSFQTHLKFEKTIEMNVGALDSQLANIEKILEILLLIFYVNYVNLEALTEPLVIFGPD